jgi:hypothetical protein
MTPTDELIAALRALGERYAHWPDGDPHAAVYQTIGDEILVALPPADRLASLTAPVGEWETTADERRSYVWALKNDININGPGVGDYTRIKFLAVLRDFDRALASLSAERDQNKRLAEVLKEALRDLENDCPYSAESSIRAVIPQEPQPEEQR